MFLKSLDKHNVFDKQCLVARCTSMLDKQNSQCLPNNVNPFGQGFRFKKSLQTNPPDI